MNIQNGISVMELIVTNKEVRGEGIPSDPVRRITQVYTKEGELVAEHDPCPPIGFGWREMVAFANWIRTKHGFPADVFESDLRKWEEIE